MSNDNKWRREADKANDLYPLPGEVQDDPGEVQDDPDFYPEPKPVTRDENGDPTLTPSPKVAAGIAASGALVVVVAVLTAITPDLLAFAGPWAPVLFAGVVALAGFVGSYVKRP